MSLDKFEDFVLPLAKSLGAYDKVHKEWGEPTLDELAWLPFWTQEATKAKLWRLYEKAHGKPLMRESTPVVLARLFTGPPRRVG